ncbi:UNVERIFIED_CONTAM: hypothetical protein NCL1_30680 [Trichonephila clavipes]
MLDVSCPQRKSLEKSFKIKTVEDEFKAEILWNMLREKMGNLMIYVKEEELSDYEKIKRIEAMFDYYCKLRNVSEFNELCQLIVAIKIINSIDQELASYINIKMCENWYKPYNLGRELDLLMSSKF